jgi:hypothetical protein
MEREEILKKVIEKAIDNGFEYEKDFEITNIDEDEFVSASIRTKEDIVYVFYHINGIIFAHEFDEKFAKYIMDSGQGEKLMYLKDNGCLFELCDFVEAFKIELVLSTDRLEYISKFIK